MKLSILPTECNCEICSDMCEAPCCGTIEDIGFSCEIDFCPFCGEKLISDKD